MSLQLVMFPKTPKPKNPLDGRDTHFHFRYLTVLKRVVCCPNPPKVHPKYTLNVVIYILFQRKLKYITSISLHKIPSNETSVVLLMADILHQLIGSFSKYLHLHGFIHPRWCWISSINSTILRRTLFKTIYLIFTKPVGWVESSTSNTLH